MIFTKIKGNLGKWPQDIPVLMRTMVADVKNPLARRSHFHRHNECHIGRIWTGPFASTWPNRSSGNIQSESFLKFCRVVGVSMANFGHETPRTPRKGMIDRLRRKSASDWYVTLSLLDQNWAYFSWLKIQDQILWDGGSRDYFGFRYVHGRQALFCQKWGGERGEKRRKRVRL